MKNENSAGGLKSKESLRTKIVYADDKFFWVNDEVINGLYTIDRKSFEVKNVLNSSQLFKYCRSKIMSIFSWEENIVIVPCEVNTKWIIYNTKNEKVQYKDVVTTKGRTAGVCIVEEQGILIPASSADPAFIVDLKTLTCIQIIKNWAGKVLERDEVLPTGSGTIVGKTVFFYLYNTKFFFEIGTKNINRYKIDIPERIFSMDCYNDEIWILPTRGNYIYTVNTKGEILDKYKLFIDKKQILVSDFVRIIAMEQYIFMLPNTNEKIGVYDKERRKFFYIDLEKEGLHNILPIEEQMVPYWGYHIEDGKIFFLPLGKRLIIIDLNTLECKKVDVFLPDFISGNTLWYWYVWNQCIIKGRINNETDKNSLRLYFKIIIRNMDNCSIKNPIIGQLIWKKVRK